jgi:RNA polymerase sigma factor (TIGR02999 family)
MSTPPRRTIPELMGAAERGDGGAADELFPLLYAELHKLAKRQLARSGGAAFPDRARFMGYAARVMRGLIIDHVRRRRAQKRGGGFELTSYDTDVQDRRTDERELARISDALDELARADPALAEIVDLRFFCGFTFAEIGAMRGVAERTVQRSWDKARIFLHRSLGGPLSP